MMHPALIDTNVLVRFFVGDNAEQRKRAAQWFRECRDGRISLVITPVVIAEVSFVLEKIYMRERVEIARFLETFIAQRWLTVDDRDVLHALWPYYRDGLHFVDSFLLARAAVRDESVLTFDKKMAKRGMRGFAFLQDEPDLYTRDDLESSSAAK